MTGNAVGIPVGPPGYDLLDEVGRGGMGVVYRARDTALGRAVAVKVLQDRFPPDGPAALRFLDEARITGQLQHPGIPAVHQVGTMPDRRPFLVMKLIKGRTLAEVLKGKTERGALLAIFEAVCQAVAYAHAHNVIHRDLKPQNVMVGTFAEVQVMDWGLAKVLGAARHASAPTTATAEDTRAWTEVSPLRESDGSYTQAGSLVGTPAYVPPEQAAGELDKVDERADVFGLGALLTVILTGQPPYLGKDAESVRVKAIRGELADALARLDACGAEPVLVALCKRCLSFAPADRPRHAGEVATAVAGLRAEAENRARQAELDRVRADGERAVAEARAAEQRKRRRVQLALAAAIVLMLCGGGALAWRHDRQAAEDQARLTRNAEAVANLLSICEEALRADDPERAALGLEAADKRATEGGAEHLAGRFARCRADLAVLRQLDVADGFQSLAENRPGGPWAMEEVMNQVVPQWREAFQGFGVVVGETSADEAARRVTESLVKDRLLNALDRWLRHEPLASVRTVLAAADPDAYREVVRDVILAKNVAKIAELARRPEALVQPPGFAASLGASPAVPRERRREMLQVALRARPGNLVLLLALGNCSASVAERLRWSQAAVSAHPRNLRPRWAHVAALRANRDMDKAIAELHEAIRLDPKSGRAHNELGSILRDKNDLDGQVEEFQEAIRLEPTIAFFRFDLAYAVYQKGDLDAAIIESREGLRLYPSAAGGHFILAKALEGKGDLDGAIGEYREAIRFNPNWAGPHTDLRQAEHRRALLVRLADIVAGRTEPATPAEACDFANVCALPFQRRFVLAVRLFEKAFAADAKLAADHRYNAACYASLAVAGKDMEMTTFGVEEWGYLNDQALAWLRADLAAWTARSKDAKAWPQVRDMMFHWKKDSDLLAVRDPAWLAAMPPADRARWENLWADVDALLAAVTQTKKENVSGQPR